jgi:chitinase/chitodextrinase
MKKSIFTLLAIAFLTPVTFVEAAPTFLTYVDRIASWTSGNNVAAGMGVPGYAPTNPYNIFALSAWLSSSGPANMAIVWDDPIHYIGTYTNPSLGTTNDQIRQSMLDRYHAAGKKVVVMAFGATDTPTTRGLNATTTCTSLANWAVSKKLDGVDLDYEDIEAMNGGTGEVWVIACTKAVRGVMPVGQYLLTHSPVAPWFSGDTSKFPGGGYLKIHKEVGDLIDYYNIQFYNQGNTSYDTYTGLFTQSAGYFPSTSLKEILDKGIPASKILLAKPAASADAYNTGYVSPSSLASWISTFRTTYPSYGWNTGVSTWQYASDTGGSYAATIAPSFAITATPDTQSPTTPTNLTVQSVSSSQINLSWTASTDNVGVSGYYVYRNSALIASISSLAYSDTELSPATSYSYAVVAYDASGNVSAQPSPIAGVTHSASDTNPPGAIANLSAANPTQTSVVLSFTAPGDNGSVGTAASYDIRYSKKNLTTKNFTQATQATGEPAPAISGTPQNYILPGLARGTTYYAAMKTKDAAGNVSTLSNILSFKTATSGAVAEASVPTALAQNPEAKLVGVAIAADTSKKSPASRLASVIVAFFTYLFGK